MLAAVRPDSWNVLLFFHVAGAMATLALLILSVYALRSATVRGDHPATRFAFRLLWRGVLPAFLVMRVFAQLIADEEKLADSEAAWIGIGYMSTDAGLLFLIIALVLTGLAARKAKAGAAVAGAAGLKVATALSGVLIAAYVVAIWAMTAKPS
jgi:hypothetical protein